jgi:hypothetical protein
MSVDCQKLLILKFIVNIKKSEIFILGYNTVITCCYKYKNVKLISFSGTIKDSLKILTDLDLFLILRTTPSKTWATLNNEKHAMLKKTLKAIKYYYFKIILKIKKKLEFHFHQNVSSLQA